MSDRSDESEAADESSSDDDAATKDRGVPGPLRDPLRGDATGVERHRGVERPLGVTGPLRGDAAGRRRRQTRVAILEKQVKSLRLAAGALAEAAYLGDTLEPSDSEDEMEAESDLDNGDEEVTDLISDGEDA